MIKKIAMLFPGQGPQYPGMGKVFYEQSAAVRSMYEQASDLLHYDMAEHSFRASFTEMADTRYAQPSILVAGYAAFRYFEEHLGMACNLSFLAGHSMGEITALLCGGALQFEQAVQLAEIRGVLMNRVSEKRGGTMAAIKELHWKRTEAICHDHTTITAPVSIAAYNTELQTVITGDEAAVTAVGEKCMEMDGIFVPLNITVASHCPFMEDIVEEYGAFINDCALRMPLVPVYSCLSGALYKTVGDIRHHLTFQLTAPVLWQSILQDMQRRGADLFMEAGPGSALGKFIEKGTVMSMEKLSLQEMQANLGMNVQQLVTPVTKCISLLISVPDLANDALAYEQFLRSYKKLQQLQATLETEKRLPSVEEVQQAAALLMEGCNAKQLPLSLMRAVQQELTGNFPAVTAYLSFHQPTMATTL